MLIEAIRPRDAQAALLRALLPRLGPAELLEARSVPWSSATFDGARHELRIMLRGTDMGERAARLEAELPESEFELRDHFVAEIQVERRSDGEMRIEVLTIAAH